MLNDIVSKRIRELRNGIKISQAKLAEKLETKQPLLARYETGEHLPTLELLIRYADYFDVSLDFIVGRTDSPQGKLYKYEPKIYGDDKMKEFIEMCFEPNSLANAKLKEALFRLLEEKNQ